MRRVLLFVVVAWPVFLLEIGGTVMVQGSGSRVLRFRVEASFNARDVYGCLGLEGSLKA